MPSDFSYLKTWLDDWRPGGTQGFGMAVKPRPVILECQVSRSGLSMSVYDREKLLYRINGCGFDRLGCALAEFLERLYQPELKKAKVANLFGARIQPDGSIYLEGMAGQETMREIAEAIGLSVQVHETRSSTLLIISKKGN